MDSSPQSVLERPTNVGAPVQVVQELVAKVAVHPLILDFPVHSLATVDITMDLYELGLEEDERELR